jgi:hypothetical protein
MDDGSTTVPGRIETRNLNSQTPPRILSKIPSLRESGCEYVQDINKKNKQNKQDLLKM